MGSTCLYVAVLVLVALSSIARAAPAFVAAPNVEAVADWNDDEILERVERQAGSGSGHWNQQFPTDDEDLSGVNVVKPTRIRKPEIHHFHVKASITARFANTFINSKLVNPEEFAQEAVFSVVLPSEAFISKFVMIIEGVAYEAEVKEKEVAQREYNEAKERGQTAGQVKQHETKPNTFTVSVNVAAYTAVLFNLTYQELLHRRYGVIEYKLSVDPGQVIRSLEVDVHITEPQGLQELDASWQSTGSGSSSGNDVLSPLQELVRLDRISQNRAHIKFHPSKDEQKAERPDGLLGNLLIQYDVVHDLSAGSLQVMNGYFVHYFSPEGLPPVRKNVVFVIDVSGSMGGSKITQTKQAMRTILADIRNGDKINIVTFTDDVEIWAREGMVDRTDLAIDDATGFVDGLRALYGTNLHQGVMSAVDLLKGAILEDRQNERESFSMIIMLTDGLPSSGVTDLNQIRDDVLAAIDGQMSLFCLGFGQDLDHSFLDNLATENQGVARKIYADSSAPLQLKGFYDEVATPLLSNINIEYNGINSAVTTQTNFPSYFDGTELIVAGQLSNESFTLSLEEGNQVTELVATVSANSMDTFIELETRIDIQTPAAAVLSRNAVDDFCQRLWAYLTIKSLLKSQKIARTREEKDELKARALELSLRYHFVTPLTSLLVVKPDDPVLDPVPEPLGVDQIHLEADQALDVPLAVPQSIVPQSSVPHRASSLNKQTAPSMGRLHHQSQPVSRGGAIASGSRGGGFADSDPHFLVRVPASDVTVCFDILGQAGEVLNLLTDKELDIQVLGFIVAAPKPVPNTNYTRTYFGSIGILLPGGHVVKVTTEGIGIDSNMVLSWGKTVMVGINKAGWSVAVRNKMVTLTNTDGTVSLVFMLHRMNPDVTYKVDHLGFYIMNHAGLSDGVHGLIGQFQRRQVTVVRRAAGADIPAAADSSATDETAELGLGDRRVNAVLKSRLNSVLGSKQPCWFVKDNARGLIDGSHTDYTVALKMLSALV